MVIFFALVVDFELPIPWRFPNFTSEGLGGKEYDRTRSFAERQVAVGHRGCALAMPRPTALPLRLIGILARSFWR